MAWCTKLFSTTAPRSRCRVLGGLCALIIFISGCGLGIPRDPNGTLARVSGGELRVGLVVEDGYATQEGAQFSGPLVDLVQSYADSIGVTPIWRSHSEEPLVTLLEMGELDLVAGPISAKTPWSARVGITREQELASAPPPNKIVLLTPAGENGFLDSLDRFLTES